MIETLIRNYNARLNPSLILNYPGRAAKSISRRSFGQSTADARDFVSRVGARSEELDAGSGAVRMSQLIGSVGLGIYVSG